MHHRQQPFREPFNEVATVSYDIETIVEDEPSDGSFPPWPRHRPVAAAFLSAVWSPEGYHFALDTVMCAQGEEAAFYEKVDKLLPVNATGITFNGHGFDNRVLSIQGMRHFASFALPGLARQAFSGRYDGAHCDLAQWFAGHGATRAVSLAELCRALDIPVKLSASGGEVGDLWRAGQYQAVRDYVREDVICNYLLWLHLIAFKKSDEKLMMLPLAELAAWIQTTPGLDHLAAFADCRPARLACARAPALRAEAALANAKIRLAHARDRQAFASSRPF